MATTTKPKRSKNPANGAPTPRPPSSAPAEPTSPSGIPLRKLPGWDVKRGGILHQDAGKRALALVKAEAARQRGQHS